MEDNQEGRDDILLRIQISVDNAQCGSSFGTTLGVVGSAKRLVSWAIQ